MHGLIVEDNLFGSHPGVKDLARHLYTRMNCGKVVIVADNPQLLLSTLRKQWLKLCRKVQRERASTLNATRVYELNQTVIRMQTLRFSTKWPQEDYPLADVCIATIEQLLSWPPEQDCRTLYVTCNVANEQLYVVTAGMARGGLVVKCRLSC